MNSRTCSSTLIVKALPCLLALLGWVVLTTTASAQTTTHRPVRRGDVTGVELQMEGALQAVRGAKLRWLLTAYEVVGLDRLRPAAGAELSIVTSFAPEEPIANITADSRGRAIAEFVVPDDAPDQFGAVLRVHARRGVSRRFDLHVGTVEPRVLNVFSGPAVERGGAVHLAGRMSRRDTRLGISDARVEVRISDGRGPLGAPAFVQTDAEGVFFHSFELPDEAVGQLNIRARTMPDDEGRRVSANAAVQVRDNEAPPLMVALQAPSIVRPGASVPIKVVVRRADGRPVEDARVRLGTRPLPLVPERDEEETDPPTHTDARGAASLHWRSPSNIGSFSDQTITVQAAAIGIGSTSGTARVRVAHHQFAGILSIENASLTPGLGGRMFARVVGADGRAAAAGVPVELRGPRIQTVRGVTDSAGAVALDIDLNAPQSGDRCGGTSSTAIDMHIGEGSQKVRTEHCVSVDPDSAARVRVEPALVEPGGAFTVSVERTRDASRLPVALAILARRDGVLHAMDGGVLDARQSEIELHAPEDFAGELIVRARPLLGQSQQEIRGAMVPVWVSPGPRLQANVSLSPARDRIGVTVASPGQGPRSIAAFAMPWDDALSFAGQMDSAMGWLGGTELGALRTTSPTPLLIAAALAARTPLDIGAPATLRGRQAEPTPAPQSPQAVGLLRDPWRASARFVQGRLALLFRAIEDTVDQAVPERLDQVAYSDRGGLRFNRQLLASLRDSSLGGEGATGLGGEPLTIERLEALDRQFNFDNVAKRITRKRLFKLLLALRDFVRSSALDLEWTRPGDPTLWLERLVNRHSHGVSIQSRDLTDGWGRPFALRPTGRARFTRLQPVSGYELVSAGADGRFGNGDDVVDPTARVLPSGSLYADAVGEDALIARLGGVELGRVTALVAGQAFGIGRPGIRAPDESAGRQSLGSLPPVFVPDRHALALRRPTIAPRRAGAHVRDAGASAEMELRIDDEPRTWGVVALVWSRGVGSVGLDGVRAGSPVLVDLRLPSRLRVDEPLEVALHLTNVTDGDGRYAIQTDASGVEIQVEPSIDIPSGQTRTSSVVLRASEPGSTTAALSITHQGSTIRELRERVHVDRGLHPIRRRASALLRLPWRVDFEVPRTAQDVQSRLVLLSPQALVYDPDFAEVREHDPALIAWAHTLAGRQLPEELRSSLLRSQDARGMVEGRDPALSTAAAIITWAASLDDHGDVDNESQQARQRAIRILPQLGNMDDQDEVASVIKTNAAVVAALATTGVSDRLSPTEQGADPLSQMVLQHLPTLRRTLRDRPGEPSLLARAAAALLLADPRDGHARAMFERLRESLHDVPGGQMLRGTEERPSMHDRLTGTLCMAVAAHQLGEDRLARDLIGAASPRSSIIARIGGETAFWWLAAGAYGALGASQIESASVTIGGRETRVAIEGGVGVLDLPLRPGSDLRLGVEASEPIFARVESVFGVPFDGREEGPISARIEGLVGEAGSVAALELHLSAKRYVGAPLLDLQLPAGVEPSDELIAALEANRQVIDAEARSPGFLRLRLAPMAEDTEAMISLPLRWRSPSTVRGLALVAYEAAHPHLMTVIAPRTLTPE